MISVRKGLMRGTALGTGLALVALVAPAIAAAPDPGKWTGNSTNGGVGHGKNGKVTFKVSSNGKEMTHFKIPEVGGFCYSGYQVISVVVPKAPIHHGKVDKHYVISNTPHDAKPTVHLKGSFKSARKFKGVVKGQHYCDYHVKFTDHPK